MPCSMPVNPAAARYSRAAKEVANMVIIGVIEFDNKSNPLAKVGINFQSCKKMGKKSFRPPPRGCRREESFAGVTLPPR